MTMHAAFTSRTAKCILAASAFCACLAGSVLLVRTNAQDAQGSATTANGGVQNAQGSAPNYDVEGDWVRTDENASGSFDGLNAYIKPAELTPEGKAILAKSPFGRGRGPAVQDTSPRPDLTTPQDAPHQAGDPYVVHQAMCMNVGNGAGTFSPDSGGFHIILGKDEAVWSGERGGSRIIYMNQPQIDETDNAHPTYHSVGHWENGVLVVDTVGRTGMSPGNGPIEKTTHLTEKFEVSADKQHMKIEYTYWDPKYYAKPLSYIYTFDRAPNAPTYAFEEWCDVSNPKEAQSIVPPEQK